MSFESGWQALREIIRGYPLRVLVWGPGESGGEHYAKRLQVRDVIKENFPRAEVRFSEEIDIPDVYFLSVPQQEYIHLALCDICVVLDTSKGSGEEIAHFVMSGFSEKLLILTNQRFASSKSFPAELRQYGNQVFYEQQEYDSCNVTRRVLIHLECLALHLLTTLQSRSGHASSI